MYNKSQNKLNMVAKLGLVNKGSINKQQQKIIGKQPQNIFGCFSPGGLLPRAESRAGQSTPAAAPQPPAPPSPSLAFGWPPCWHIAPPSSAFPLPLPISISPPKLTLLAFAPSKECGNHTFRGARGKEMVGQRTRMTQEKQLHPSQQAGQLVSNYPSHPTETRTKFTNA